MPITKTYIQLTNPPIFQQIIFLLVHHDKQHIQENAIHQPMVDLKDKFKFTSFQKPIQFVFFHFNFFFFFEEFLTHRLHCDDPAENVPFSLH